MSDHNTFSAQRSNLQKRLTPFFQTPQTLVIAIEYAVMKLEGMTPGEFAEYLPSDIVFEDLLDFTFSDSKSDLRRFVNPEIENARRDFYADLQYFTSGSGYSFSFEADDIEVGFQRRNK